MKKLYPLFLIFNPSFLSSHTLITHMLDHLILPHNSLRLSFLAFSFYVLHLDLLLFLGSLFFTSSVTGVVVIQSSMYFISEIIYL